MKIIYSFNKAGYEATKWEQEIRAASIEDVTFIPFNHGEYMDPSMFHDAWRLDILYQNKNPALMRMYAELEEVVREQGADVLFVTNFPPYHPDFLRRLQIYKILYSTDDPGSTYGRTIPYLHAYHHVFYCDPAYSADLDMNEKMRYCGMTNADWLPLAVFDFERGLVRPEDAAADQERDIDIIYVGSAYRQKMGVLAKVKKAFGRRFQQYGFFTPKQNVYYNVWHGFPGWIRPVSFQKRLQLYRRAKIGVNIHWNDFGLGNQRLYHLPANGVMQICDCPADLNRIFKVDEEVVAYSDADDLIDKISYYLSHPEERNRIAAAGYRRTVEQYLFHIVARQAAGLIQQGMKRIGWEPPGSFAASRPLSHPAPRMV